ncbi:MAG TPA: hypothetical protein VFQ61_08550 [Polyangiaceae bacterium]|nr:hypothetical protein [Polyangiaceae bacterium]
MRNLAVDRLTVYTHLRWAERLATLTPEAECEANATALANQLGTLARIAALPDPMIQRDLALRFDRQRTQVKKELAEREREFGLPTPSRSSKKAREPIDAEQEVNTASDDSENGVAGGVEEENHADLVSGERSKSFDDARAQEPGLAAIEAMLGASTLDGCLDAIRGLQGDRSEIEVLRSKLKHVEAKCAKLESHLTLYERAPLGELFRTIGVTNVHDAIERTRALVGVSNAAE